MYPNSPHAARPNARAFARHEIIDRQNGMVVAAFAHPCAWQAQSEVMWNLQHTDLPARVWAVTHNPQGAECCEFFPPQGFFRAGGGSRLPPTGQTTHGFTHSLARPAPDAPAGPVIPNLRVRYPGLRVTRVAPVPNLRLRFNDPPPHNGERVMARAEYGLQGRPDDPNFSGRGTWTLARRADGRA